MVPPAVWHEVVTEGKGRAGATEVEQAQKAGWLHVTQPQNKNLVHLLQQQLDVGKAEAIEMAIENNGSLFHLVPSLGLETPKSLKHGRVHPVMLCITRAYVDM